MGEARGVGARLTAHVDIDAHGRVIPQADEARRDLADRAGRFLLLPSVPDLLVARRVPAVGGPRPRARCVLAGDLAGFPIADFVAFIHQSRLSGTLTVSARGVDRALLFRDGEVRGARSSGPGERIGEVALRLGYVDERQLAAAAAAAGPIGKALVDQGLLAAADLWKCIHEQVATVFHGVLLAREGVFTLAEESGTAPASPLSVNTQSLLMDGIRRIDEMVLFRERVPGPDAYLRARKAPVAVALDRREQQVLALVDGRRTVAELAQAAHLGEFDATRTLYHLVEAGYVEVAEAPAPPPETPAVRTEAAVTALNAILRRIAEEAGRAGQRELLLAGVRAFLADRSGRFGRVWQGVSPGPDGALDPAALQRSLTALDGATLPEGEQGEDPVRHLLSALRELMFFYLFQARELLPRAADEELNLEVKRRLEALGEER